MKVVFELLLSCDLGFDNGSDLVGTWISKESGFEKFYTFNSDGTGEYKNRDSPLRLTYEVYMGGNIYKILELRIENIYSFPSTTIEIDKYEYFFSADKKSFYLKDENSNTLTWYKYDKK